jgi:hypothetical protein
MTRPDDPPGTGSGVGSGRSEWDLAAVIAAEVGKPKPWYLSRTLIGLLVLLASQAAKGAGLEIESEALTDAIVTGLDLLGAGLVWWGRVAATRPISRRAVLPGVVLGGGAADGESGGVRSAGADGRAGAGRVPSDAGGDGAERGYWSGARRGPFDDHGH